MDQRIAEDLGRTLMYFDGEEEKKQRLEMLDSLQSRILLNRIKMTPKLFDAFVYVYTESQQWSKVNTLLAQSTVENCVPEFKTVGFLKKNIVYCFDPSMRGSLKDNIDTFEDRFFGKAAFQQHSGSR